MIPKINYKKAKSLNEASVYLAEKNSKLLSGGTDLLVQIRSNLCGLDTLIDIKGLSELNQIIEKDSEIFIGSAVTFSKIIESKIINEKLPILIQAAKKVGGPQIRNQATIGGNVQTASPAGDGLVALFALEAEVELVSQLNERKVSIKNYITGPKQTDKKQDEIIRGFWIPKRNFDYQSFFKVGKRNALSISIVNGVIGLNIDKNKIITEALIVLGAVAPTPVRIENAENLIKGKQYNEEISAKLQEEIMSMISPINDIRASKEYRGYISAVICENIIIESLEDMYNGGTI